LPNKNPSQSNAQGITYTARDSGRLPYVQNWTLGFQYQLPAAFVVEANYVGNKGTRLLAPGWDSLNQVPLSELSRGNMLGDPWTAASGIPQPFPGFTGTNLQALRPFPQFTGISQGFPNLGTSTYNALQLQLTRHFRKGLAILVAHTFSKTINMSTDSSGSIDGSDSIGDVFNRRIDRSIANFHYPHFFKVTWIYELPIGTGKTFNVGKIGNAVVGGWSFTGNHFARSGSPLGIGVNVAANPITTTRPDLVVGQSIISNANAGVSFRGFVGGETYLNRAAFTDPPVSPGGRNYVTRLGSLGPFLPNVRGPMSQGHDLGVVKAHKFTESVTWEIRGVFQNFMNQTLRNNPVTALNNAFFGQITGKGGRRNIELSTRITF
jgi:hypothetical protein